MDMQFVITEQEAGSLKVSIVGSRVELTGFASGRKVTVEGAFGDITVRLLPVEVQQSAPELPVVEAVSEAKAVEPVISDAPQEVEPEVIIAEEPEQSLFEKLVILRKQIAVESKLPPYIIFHDSTLTAMCRLLPTDLQALGDVSGVGEAKLAKYGMRFVEAISEYIGKYGIGRVA